MYMNLPPSLQGKPGFKGKVLWLNRSLYGHRYAAKLFYELICKVLVGKLNFQVSPHDHCLFIQKDCLIVTWVDDAIIITKEQHVADTIIEEIKKYNLDLDKQNAGGLAEYLDINIHKLLDGSTELTQTGLIEQIVESMGLGGANGKWTPETETLAHYKEHEAFDGHLLELPFCSRHDIVSSQHNMTRYLFCNQSMCSVLT